MGRPVKWSRELHSLRECAAHARTETWGRLDIEQLFGVGRATAQTLMKAIGEVHERTPSQQPFSQAIPASLLKPRLADWFADPADSGHLVCTPIPPCLKIGNAFDRR